MGADISNTNGLAKVITLTGTNAFNGNKSIGLFLSSNGLITLNNVTASNNEGTHGAYLSNLGSTTKAGVILNGTNAFNSNIPPVLPDVAIGLYISSLGNVKTNSVTANSNSNTGVYINLSDPNAVGSVTMNGANNFNGNTNTNLNIVARVRSC